MSLLLRRIIKRARKVVKRLEDKMPRDLARVVGGYMSPEAGAEFGVKLGDNVRSGTDLRAWVCPVLDQAGNHFYMSCEADLWPLGCHNWWQRPCSSHEHESEIRGRLGAR